MIASGSCIGLLPARSPSLFQYLRGGGEGAVRKGGGGEGGC